MQRLLPACNICCKPARGSRRPETESAVSAMLRAIDTTLWTVDPFGTLGREHIAGPLLGLRLLRSGFLPGCRGDEQTAADDWWAHTSHDSPEARTILARHGYRTPLSAAQRRTA